MAKPTTSLETKVQESVIALLKSSVLSAEDKARFVKKQTKDKASARRCWVSATEEREHPPQSGNYEVLVTVTFRVNAFKDGEEGELEPFYACGVAALKGRIDRTGNTPEVIDLPKELSKTEGLKVYGITRDEPGEERSVRGGHMLEKEVMLKLFCGEHD